MSSRFSIQSPSSLRPLVAGTALALMATLAACGKGEAPGGGFGGMPPAMVTYEVVATREVPVERLRRGESAWRLIDAVELRRRPRDHFARRLVSEDEGAASDQRLEERRLRIDSRHAASEP